MEVLPSSPESSPFPILESGFSLSEQAHHDQHDELQAGYEFEINSFGRLRELGVKGSHLSEPEILSVDEVRQAVVDDMLGCSIPTSSLSASSSTTHALVADGSSPNTNTTTVMSPLEYQAGNPAILPLVYCDFTASHRPLKSVEDYLSMKCLPFYGNTHTNTSLTGSQSTAFCSEARQIIGEFTGAKTTGKASRDVVLFAGNGTTCAVQLLIDCLGLKHADHDPNDRPVIFVGPFEHHSNILPWRELGNVEIHTVKLENTKNSSGSIDLSHLEALLKRYNRRTVKIGTFAAASNVTGARADDIAITALLHRYGALSVWDYATAASYVDPQMNPSHPDYADNPTMIAKDAIVLSGHKLMGAVGSPGVLVVKKHLVSQQNPPAMSGGGTVFYVTSDHHRFLSNRIERYEGGTPNILGIWRLGLAIKAKQQHKKQLQEALTRISTNIDVRRKTSALSLPSVIDYETRRAQSLQHRLEQIPNLVLMDGSYGDGAESTATLCSHRGKLPIFSFLIKCGDRFLHFNFVCALLNDLFGIQSRGGCQCAGPFAQRLLGLDNEISNVNHAVEESLVHAKDELLRPGFTRLSLPLLGTTPAMEEYVLDAIAWVANYGWKFLHVYRCNHRSGEWRHKSRPGAPLGKAERKWLSHYRVKKPDAALLINSQQKVAPSLKEAMSNANTLLEIVTKDQSSLMQALKMTHEGGTASSEGTAISTLAALRWYVYPKEVALFVQQGLDHVPGTMERNKLVGAIRPLAWFDESRPEVPTRDVTGLQNPQLASPQVASIMFHFRDGEHTGTAPLQELQIGLDDGELTDKCLIYNAKTDSWEPIEEMLERECQISPVNIASLPSDAIALPNRNGANAGSSGQENSTTNNEATILFPNEGILDQVSPEEINEDVDNFANFNSDMSTDVVSQRNGILNGSSEDEGITFTEPIQSSMHSQRTPKLDIPVIEKNTRKKPQRDSSAWGQGEMVSLRPSNDSPKGNFATENQISRKKEKRHKHVKPPAKLMRLVTQAMIQWEMLQEGDRLLLGLSGGKDSLSLLHVLLEFQKKLPINFEIEVCTIDPLTPSFDPSPLIPYIQSLGLKYHYIRDNIVERANNAGKDGAIVSSLCSYCARMKRGNLYTCARNNNCNKLVLAQHLDDLAESFMMSVMHNGFLRTMKANYQINAGDLSVIRPLVYCRESLMTAFAKSASLPIINENCPACFEEPKERARIKKLLSREESLYPNFYDNIKRSLLPLMHDDATAILRSYTEEAIAKSRKENQTKKYTNGFKASSVVKGKPLQHLSNKKTENDQKQDSSCLGALSQIPDDDLIRELARRRAEKYRMAGAMKRLNEEEDPTGQVCTLNGGNGSIPCRELME